MNDKQNNNFSCVILAAGKGTRMKSELPKVMHKLAGAPLVSHVLNAVLPLSPQKIVVITSPTGDLVRAECAKISAKPFSFENGITQGRQGEVYDIVHETKPDAGETLNQARIICAVQDEQLGTGHAVGIAKPEFVGYDGKILVLCGDTPLITSETLANLLENAASSEVAVLGMILPNPTGYGRLLTDDNMQIQEIIEERDANSEQKKINLCNSGIMAISGKYLFDLLAKVTANNNAGEYYLTDIIAIANDMGLHCKAVVADAEELSGINTRAQLADAENVFQQRLRAKAMENGATLIDPASVFLQVDTKITADVVIHPSVVFGAGVSIETGVEIRSFSHIEGAYIKAGATIGPFARIRPNSVVGAGAHIGNFVELKNTNLGDGAKANHLSYVGDAEVGAKANIGAGTITCNYDGVNKYKTEIGAGAFIGSNSSLVAPVIIGAGAVTGAGSVITQNVPENHLAIERGLQVNKPKKIGIRKPKN